MKIKFLTLAFLAVGTAAYAGDSVVNSGSYRSDSPVGGPGYGCATESAPSWVVTNNASSSPRKKVNHPSEQQVSLKDSISTTSTKSGFTVDLKGYPKSHGKVTLLNAQGDEIYNSSFTGKYEYPEVLASGDYILEVRAFGTKVSRIVHID